MSQKNRNINYFIVVFTLLIFMAVSILTFVSESYDNNKEQNSEYLQEVAIQISFATKYKFEEVLQRVEDRAIMLSLICYSNDNMDITELDKIEALNSDEKINEFKYVDKMGNILNVEDSISIADREYFKQILDQKSGISEVIDSKITDEKCFVIYAPIIKDNVVKGGVFKEYTQEVFEREFQLTSFSEKGFSHIVDDNGNIVSVVNHEDSFKIGDNIFEILSSGTDEKNIGMMQQNFNMHRGSHIEYTLNDQKQLGYYEPVGINNWFIFTVIPTKIVNDIVLALDAPLISLLIKMGIGFIGCVVLLIIVMMKRHSQMLDANDTLKTKSERDPLTNLYNRSGFVQRVDKILSNKLEENSYYVLFMIDLDKFKLINDIYGHQEGDLVLKEVGSVLQMNCRYEDCVGRIGGDEYMVFMGNIKSETEVENKATKLCAKLKEIQLSNGKRNQVSGSIGIAMAPKDGKNFEELYHKADSAAYYAKANGRNQFCIFREGL